MSPLSTLYKKMVSKENILEKLCDNWINKANVYLEMYPDHLHGIIEILMILTFVTSSFVPCTGFFY